VNGDAVDALRMALEAQHAARVRHTRQVQRLMWLALAAAVAVAVLA
jgi:hypothetical protein